MDPNIEIVFSEHAVEEILRERFEFPLFFLVGGADDSYLSRMIGSPIRELTISKSVDDHDHGGIFGVYASRALLPTTGRVRTFSIFEFLNDRWPILDDIESTEKDTKIPTNIERTWIIRALRRAGQNDLAEKIRDKMLNNIYPEKINLYSISNNLDQLYLNLSDRQKEYPAIILVDDLPVQLPVTIGEILLELISGGCTNRNNLKYLRTSIQLLQDY